MYDDTIQDSHRQGRKDGASGMRQRLLDTSIAVKLLLGGVLIALTVLVLGVGLLSNTLGRTLYESSRNDLTRDVNLVKGLVEVELDALQDETIRLNQALMTVFTSPLSLDSVVTGRLKAGALVLNDRTQEVDRFTQQTGAAATLFVRQDRNFLRIASSLRNERGERVTGTMLDQTHGAYALLLAGKPYTGLAHLFGKDYFSSYRPILNESGQVIGASFVGLDVTSELAALKTRIRAMNIGKTGYFYVLDGSDGANRGQLIVHPAKEGANILEATDASGKRFIQDMIQRKTGITIYPWRNLEKGEQIARDKIVVFDEVPNTHWIVAGGSYLDEFDALSRQIRTWVLVGGVLMLLLMGWVLFWMVRRMILRPLSETVLPVFQALESGRFDSSIPLSRGDEIGQVLQGLARMQAQLGANAEAVKRHSDAMTQIKIGLDNVTSNVRIANQEGILIYVNKALDATFRRDREAFANHDPSFDPERIIGYDICRLYEDPEAARARLQSLSVPSHRRMLLGGRLYDVTNSPILNQQGERLGSVGEWVDVTDQVAAENELAQVIRHAAQGDFAQRLDMQGRGAFFENMGAGINQLMDTSASGLREVANVLNALAAGDLTQEVRGVYQGTFGQLKVDTNATVARLQTVVGRIQEATQAINVAIQEIVAGNQDLSNRTEQQASKLEEASSSMEQLNATVKQNAIHARQANDLTHESHQGIIKGGSVVRQVVQTMGDIQVSSRRIEDIIGVIDSIAFQTNILALNAAVEAARAGEQGRGFAVVASEVRNLAQRSATAAREIKGLIVESVGKVTHGATLVAEAGLTMEGVVSSFQKVATLINQISQASVEQAAGIEQVTDVVAQMDDVTQQNAAMVEQATSAAESLEEQAQGLVQMVSRFRLKSEMTEGRSLEAARPPAGRKGLSSPQVPALSGVAIQGWK